MQTHVDAFSPICGAALRIAVLSAVLTAGRPAAADPSVTEPWSVCPSAPVLPVESGDEPRVGPADFDTTGGLFCYGWLRFYQTCLPPVTRSRCPMFPSCSQFAVLAVRTHGAFWGIAMTADRLFREGSEARSSPALLVGGRYILFDPVGRNDFWWRDTD